jgi:hypothetical protein
MINMEFCSRRTSSTCGSAIKQQNAPADERAAGTFLAKVRNILAKSCTKIVQPDAMAFLSEADTGLKKTLQNKS